MEYNYIRKANEADENLITAYFKQALEHYESQGELLAIQDIKYFIQNMDTFNFYVKEHTEEFITYTFEFSSSMEGEAETGELSIPLTNNNDVH